MGMDNPVTSLTIKKIQPNYCNFDLLSFKLSETIILFCYITLIDRKKMVNL